MADEYRSHLTLINEARLLASAPEIAAVSEGVDLAVHALVSRLEGLLNLAGIPRSLRECGVDPVGIPLLATEAARQWTASFNPRPIASADFVTLYELAMERRGEGG